MVLVLLRRETLSAPFRIFTSCNSCPLPKHHISQVADIVLLRSLRLKSQAPWKVSKVFISYRYQHQIQWDWASRTLKDSTLFPRFVCCAWWRQEGLSESRAIVASKCRGSSSRCYLIRFPGVSRFQGLMAGGHVRGDSEIPGGEMKYKGDRTTSSFRSRNWLPRQISSSEFTTNSDPLGPLL